MGAQHDLEKQMDDLLVKKAPFQIPEDGRKTIVKYLPIIALVFGILSLLAALRLYNATRKVAEYADEINELSRAFGNGNVVEYTFLYYIALLVLVLQGLILLVAFKPLKSNQKKGWDLLLLGVVTSFAFGLMYLFTDFGNLANFIGTIIGTVIGLYILAQIRSHYKGSVTAKKEETKK